MKAVLLFFFFALGFVSSEECPAVDASDTVSLKNVTNVKVVVEIPQHTFAFLTHSDSDDLVITVTGTLATEDSRIFFSKETNASTGAMTLVVTSVVINEETEFSLASRAGLWPVLLASLMSLLVMKYSRLSFHATTVLLLSVFLAGAVAACVMEVEVTVSLPDSLQHCIMGDSSVSFECTPNPTLGPTTATGTPTTSAPTRLTASPTSASPTSITDSPTTGAPTMGTTNPTRMPSASPSPQPTFSPSEEDISYPPENPTCVTELAFTIGIGLECQDVMAILLCLYGRMVDEGISASSMGVTISQPVIDGVEFVLDAFDGDGALLPGGFAEFSGDLCETRLALTFRGDVGSQLSMSAGWRFELAVAYANKTLDPSFAFEFLLKSEIGLFSMFGIPELNAAAEKLEPVVLPGTGIAIVSSEDHEWGWDQGLTVVGKFSLRGQWISDLYRLTSIRPPTWELTAHVALFAGTGKEILEGSYFSIELAEFELGDIKMVLTQHYTE